MVDKRGVWEPAGVMHLHCVSLLVVDHIRDVGHRSDHLHVELPVESLLHDFHVKQAKEATAETKAQSLGRLRHKRQCGIVELQFLKRRPEVLIFIGINRINTGKHHRLHLLEALDSLVAGLVDMCDCFSDLHLGSVFDARDDIANLTRRELLARLHVHLEHTHFISSIFHSRLNELQFISSANHSILYFAQHDDAAERVEDRVKDQCLQRFCLVTLGRRNTLYHSIEDVRNTLTRLTTGTDDLGGITAYQVHNLILNLIGHSVGHVDLVDDRDNLQVVVNGHI